MGKFIFYLFLYTTLIVLSSPAQAKSTPPIKDITKKVSVRANVLDKGELKFHKENADFIRIHFKEMNLPKKVYVEVSNPEGTEFYRYYGKANSKATFSPEDIANDKKSFSAMSITGDTAIVRVVGNKGLINRVLHKVQVDYFTEGDFSRMEEADGAIDDSGNYCPNKNYVDVKCYENTNPEAYERTRPVAKIISNTSCTAWRVGADNRMITNNHCVSTQDRMNETEVWFNYQATSCDGDTIEMPVKVTANQLLRTNYELDYTVFTVNDFTSIQSFGHFGLDVRQAQLNEHIYIPNHGGGLPKFLSIENELGTNGLCDVGSNATFGREKLLDISYACDTRGGSSGSPVLAADTHRVIALHHFARDRYCQARGVKISLIWPAIADLFNNVVPTGDGQPTAPAPAQNTLPVADFTYQCDGDGYNCTFDASPSYDPDGEIIRYSWSLGTYIFGKTVTKYFWNLNSIYSEEYSQEITLTVIDNNDGRHSITKTIDFSTNSNLPPKSSFTGVSCSETYCEITSNTSSDSDGSIVNYHWDWGDGTYSEGPDLKFPSHTYSGTGSFSIRLTVTDDKGLSSYIDRTATISSSDTNVKKVPSAGTYYPKCYDLECDFYSSIYTYDGSVVSNILWEFSDGASYNAKHVRHTFPEPGTYFYKLTVTDSNGNTNSRISRITVNIEGDSVAVPPPANEAPSASFISSCNDLICSFTNTSTDSDGSIASVNWNFGDGTSSSTVNPSKTYAQTGTYTVTLTVADDDGATDSASAQVSVTEPPPKNIAPTASISPACDELSCVFTSTSTDSDGSIVSAQWNLGDGANKSGNVINHSYAQAGTYTVILTITDDDGATDSASAQVSVTEPPPANEAPSASFFSSCNDLICSFTNTSTDSDGSIASVNWNFGDGTSSSTVNPSKTYAQAGSYIVTLTVTDDEGATDSASAQVSVTEPPPENIAPTASISPACDELSCVFTSTSTDSDGSIVSAQWSLGDGANKSGNVINHSYAQAGTYTVILTVTDDDGATDSASAQVSVTEPVDNPPTVSITSPANGDTVSGNVTIQAYAQDDNGVVAVKFYINNVEVKSDTSSPFTHTFDSTQYANGSVNLKAVAYDTAGLTDQSSITVTVDNVVQTPTDTQAPTVSITSPSDGASITAGSQITLTANASDNVGISYVRFLVDGSVICTDSTVNYTCRWVMPNAKNKTYFIQAIAVDSSGNSSSDNITISTVHLSGGDKPCRGNKCN